MNTIAMSGLWSWSNGNGELIKDFEEMVIDGREIHLVPDNDFNLPNRRGVKKNLKQAIYRLAHKLIDLGAKVFIVHLPEGEEYKGLDDYLCHHSVEEFKKLPVKEVRKLTIEESIKEVTSETLYDEIDEIIKRIAQVKSPTERALYINNLQANSSRLKKRDIKEAISHYQQKSDSSLKENDFTLINEDYCRDAMGYIYRIKKLRYEQIKIKISNFRATITKEITEDDGADVKLLYAIEGEILTTKKKLPEIEILSNAFSTLNWIHQFWGNQPVIEPGQGTKDYIRHLIQVESNPERETVYTCTGWREINATQAYLSGNGAIGMEKVSSRLPKGLDRYNLPLNVKNEKEAIQTSLSFLDLADHEKTFPLFALLYLAPLTTIVENTPNFSGYILGGSGSLKSSLAVIMLAHLGTFRNVQQLSNFTDSANNAEKYAFWLKDTLMVLDDYHPSTDKKEAKKMEELAQRTIRAYSNRTGRGRLNHDTSDKGRFHPQGMLLITGEELVSLESTLARIMIVEINKGEVNKEKLSVIQEKASLLPHAMSSYILWIQKNMKDITSFFDKRFITLRKTTSIEGSHGKLNEQVAYLQATLETVLNWLKTANAINDEQAEDMSDKGWKIFKKLRDQQSLRLQEESPVKRFLEILSALINQEKVKLSHVDLPGEIIGGNNGNRIGHYDETFLYLRPRETWHELREYLIREGSYFPLKKERVYTMLRESHLIETKKNENTIPVTIHGKKDRFLKLLREGIAF